MVGTLGGRIGTIWVGCFVTLLIHFTPGSSQETPCSDIPPSLLRSYPETMEPGTILHTWIMDTTSLTRLTLLPAKETEPEGYLILEADPHTENVSIILNRSLSLNLLNPRDPPVPNTKEEINCNYTSPGGNAPVVKRQIAYELVCVANWGGTDVNLRQDVIVAIQGVNDEQPYFMCDPYYKTINEMAPLSTTIFALDGLAASSHVLYDIHSYHLDSSSSEEGTFALAGSAQNGIIVLKEKLDYDYGIRQYNLTVTATDDGEPALTSNSTTLYLTITDGDDQSPTFDHELYIVTIPEENDTVINTTFVGSPPVEAYDLDYDLDAELEYTLNGAPEFFSLNRTTAEVIPRVRLDRETTASYLLSVQAHQIDNPLKRKAWSKIRIDVSDINDNKPEMTSSTYSVSVPEYYPNGLFLIQVNATDRDEGVNAQFHFELVDPLSVFTLNNLTGEVFVGQSSQLDRETRPYVEAQVHARETHTAEQWSSNVSVIRVTLLDVNDNNPVFYPPQINIHNLTSPIAKDDVIGQVFANDTDEGRNGVVTYHLGYVIGGNSSWFGVNNDTGNVYARDDIITWSDVTMMLFVRARDNPLLPDNPRYSQVDATVHVMISAMTTSGSTVPTDSSPQLSTSAVSIFTTTVPPSTVTHSAPTDTTNITLITHSGTAGATSTGHTSSPPTFSQRSTDAVESSTGSGTVWTTIKNTDTTIQSSSTTSGNDVNTTTSYVDIPPTCAPCPTECPNFTPDPVSSQSSSQSTSSETHTTGSTSDIPIPTSSSESPHSSPGTQPSGSTQSKPHPESSSEPAPPGGSTQTALPVESSSNPDWAGTTQEGGAPPCVGAIYETPSEYWVLIVVAVILGAIVIALVIISSYQGYQLQRLRKRSRLSVPGTPRSVEKLSCYRSDTSAGSGEAPWSFEAITAAMDYADFVASDSDAPAVLPPLPVTNQVPSTVRRFSGYELVEHETVVLSTSREALHPREDD